MQPVREQQQSSSKAATFSDSRGIVGHPLSAAISASVSKAECARRRNAARCTGTMLLGQMAQMCPDTHGELGIHHSRSPDGRLGTAPLTCANVILHGNCKPSLGGGLPPTLQHTARQLCSMCRPPHRGVGQQLGPILSCPSLHNNL